MEAHSGEQEKVQRSKLTPQTSIVYTNTGDLPESGLQLKDPTYSRGIQSHQGHQSEADGNESTL